MCHRIGHRKQVGFRAKADLASGPAANDLERSMWKRVLKALVAASASLWLTAVCGFEQVAFATISDDDVCWDPDIEFPVPCDTDDD